MTKEERANFLRSFSRSMEWRKIRETILVRLDAPYWMIDEDGNYLSEVKQNRRYCQMIKETRPGRKSCKEDLNRGIELMKEKKGPIVTRCHAELMGFVSPLIAEERIIGAIGGCQIVDHDLPDESYQEVVERLGLDHNKFISCLNELEAVSKKLLETEVELIHLLCQSSIEIVTQKQVLKERDIFLDNLLQFYRLLEEKRHLFIDIDPEGLYQLILDITLRSINCEISSLMLIDPGTNYLRIKAATGISKEVVAKTKVRLGEGVAGWVTLQGEPLLVKDITQDPRFRPIGSGQYYNNSLVSAPIKIDQETIGVINVNNESTRRIFNEGDLRLLTLIAENAGVAIEGARIYEERRHKEWTDAHTLEERQEALRLQIERMKVETERLRQRAKEIDKWREEATLARAEASDADRLRQEADRIRREAVEAKEVAERERLKAEAARLQVEAEDLEHKEEADLLRRQVEDLKSRVEQLQSEEETLKVQISEAEELLAHAERTKELEEETERLRRQIEEMKREQENLKLQIEEAEKLRARAEEAERLRAQTEELNTLYELSKEIISIPEPKEIPPWSLGKIQPLLNYDISAYILLDQERLFGGIRPLKPTTEAFIDEFKTQMIDNWKAILPDAKEPLELEIEVDSENVLSKRGRSTEFKFYSTPIIDRNSPTGILYVGHLPGDGGAELTRRVLPIVGAHASVALEKLRIYLETKDLVDRDDLTGIYNFRYFGKRFMDEFKLSVRNKRPFSLLMIDFDHLKRFNDTFGHEEGNQLIKTIARVIKGQIRDVDILARFGGDEFVVILPETQGGRASEVAERILESMRSYRHIVGGRHQKITASIGVGSYPELKAKSAKDFFMRTDEALYQAKENGRNQVFVYGGKMSG